VEQTSGGERNRAAMYFGGAGDGGKSRAESLDKGSGDWRDHLEFIKSVWEKKKAIRFTLGKKRGLMRRGSEAARRSCVSSRR